MKIRFLYIFLLSVLFFSCEDDTLPVNNPEKNTSSPVKSVSLKNSSDTVFYSLGVVVASQMKNYGIKDIDYKTFFAGIKDALENSDNQLMIHPDVAQRIVNLYANKQYKIKQTEYYAQNNKISQENKQNSDIVTTQSGLQYKIVKQGNGKKPNLDNFVTIKFTGQLPDGTVFSSTNDKAVKFKLRNSIKGWQQGISQMREGEIRIFYIPPELAFGSKGSKKVPPNSTVIYKIELVKVD